MSNSRSTSFVLVVDSPKRDLRGVVLTAYHLARMKREVYVTPMYMQGYDVPRLAPDFVLLNYIRESNKELARTYRMLGIRLAIMDTEGGVLSQSGLDEPSTWARSLKETGLASLVDTYLFWGETVYGSFRAFSGMGSQQLHLTGCPRYDLCAPPWNAKLAYRHSGFVLVNTNFSAINPAFTRSSEAEKHIFRSVGWSDAYIESWFSELEALFPRYLDEIEALALAMPDQLIVVRPHPFEDPDCYLRRFDHLPNIEVDGSGDVLNMIHGASCIVHLNCGTSVDAVLQQKVPVSLEYLNTKLLLDHTPLPSRLSVKPNSRNELIETVRGVMSGTLSFDHSAAFGEIEPWFYRADGKAAERVAVTLAEQPRGNPRRSLLHATRGARGAPTLGQIAQGTAATIFGSRVVDALRSAITPTRRNKRVSVAEVQSLLDFYASAVQGPRFRARSARGRVIGLPLSTIEICPE